MSGKRFVSLSWVRFRIQTLLIVVAIVCIYLATKANHVRVQKHAVAAITEAGGSVRYRHQPNWSSQHKRRMMAWRAGVTEPKIDDIVGEPPGPTWIREMIGDEYFQDAVEVLFVNGRRIDSVARDIASLSHLETLKLRDSDVSDNGVKHFLALKNLKELDVSRTNIGDDGLYYLGQVRGLESLTANNITNATDSGWASLVELHNLKKLSMKDAVVNDGLRHLVKLPSLQTLDLQFSHVNDDGLTHLVGHSLEFAWAATLCRNPLM